MCSGRRAQYEQERNQTSDGLPRLDRSEEVHAAQGIRLVEAGSSLRQLQRIPSCPATLFRGPCELSINNVVGRAPPFTLTWSVS